MAADEAYSRRIAAILIADVTGYSALVGQNDERTARAVKRLQTDVHAIVADARGYSDARAGDAIFASFDSVVAAVQCALAIQRHVAEAEFEGHRLQVRIGIHFGDVLVRDGTTVGEGVGDAINVAARLQALARPGTVCISEAVYLQVRNRLEERFIDLGRQTLKNISYPVHAYLLIPREHLYHHDGGRRRAGLIAGMVLVGLVFLAAAAGVFVQRNRTTQAEPEGKTSSVVAAGDPGAPVASDAGAANEPTALGVMLFKAMGGAPDDWRSEALRDELNTQLSRLSSVKVYSKEFIDFLISRRGLTEIEAATQLGISKMLSGSFLIANGTMRIETHVVDVPTGVLESSNTITGPEDAFVDLQTDLVFEVIARLDLPVTPAERKRLLAQRTTNQEALKMLLEAEGGIPPATPDPADPERRSSLPRWLAQVQALAVGTALADDAAVHATILATIERYRRAMESRDLEALAAVYLDFPAEQRAAQQRYFENVRDLKVLIENPDIAVIGDEAVVSYTRDDTFVDARTGRPMHASVRLTKILRHVDGEWKMAAK
jgi:class 3 adenylate cyclase/TolB-like protein/ketosteroid isomerase-like protein